MAPLWIHIIDASAPVRGRYRGVRALTLQPRRHRNFFSTNSRSIHTQRHWDRTMDGAEMDDMSSIAYEALRRHSPMIWSEYDPGEFPCNVRSPY